MRITASLLLIKLSFCYAQQAQPVSLQQASWISNTNPEPVIKRVASVFRKQFDVNKQLRKATTRLTSLGLYEASIDGAHIGNDHFTPGFTNYFKRLQYLEYDITKQSLKAGYGIPISLMADCRTLVSIKRNGRKWKFLTGRDRLPERIRHYSNELCSRPTGV